MVSSRFSWTAAVSARRAGLLESEGLVESLGPHTLEPATLVRNYEHSEDVLVVAATAKETSETLSRLRLEQIAQLMRDLVPGDRMQLATMAASGGFSAD